jgi:hypothetical protein
MGERLISTVQDEIFTVGGFEVRFVGRDRDTPPLRVDGYDYERAANGGCV